MVLRLPRTGEWPSGLVFVVLEAAPRRLGSGKDSGRKRAESGGVALGALLGGVGVGGTRSFFRNSSRSLASSSLRAEKTASLESVFGPGSFNDENAATRWDALHASGSRYALVL